MTYMKSEATEEANRLWPKGWPNRNMMIAAFVAGAVWAAPRKAHASTDREVGSPDPKETPWPNENPQFAEMFWARYLKALAEMGAVTAETPADEIWQMKADFMAGLRGEPMPCETEARTE